MFWNMFSQINLYYTFFFLFTYKVHYLEVQADIFSNNFSFVE